WSYGVLPYELFSYGKVPYEKVDTEQLLEHLEGGNRLEKPQTCTDNIYRMMLECWSAEPSKPSKRPSFDRIRLALGILLEQRPHLCGYLDASVYYVALPYGSDIEA
ncbi:Tyrosine-protein kinase F09A5.2 in chromosome X, partial [Aphelenchoides avenae]